MLKRPDNTIIVPVKGKNYVYAVTEKIYKKDRRYNVNKRICVGKMVDDVFMVPNKAFSSVFPDLVDLSDTPSASDTLKVGTYIAVKKILKSLELDALLDDVYGNDADMIKDIAKSDQLSTNASLKAAFRPVAVLVNVTESGVSHLTSLPVDSQ